MKNYILCLCLLVSSHIYGQDIKIESPSKLLFARIVVNNDNRFIELKNSKEIITQINILDFDFEKEIIEGNWHIIDKTEIHVNNTWKPVYGERSTVTDKYNELTLELKSAINSKQIMLIVRLYDEGIALKYKFDPLDFWGTTLTAENTSFVFDKNADVWTTHNAQGVYAKSKLDSYQGEVERPLVVELAPSLYLALGEAALVDFSRMKFKNTSNKNNSRYIIQTALSGKVNLAAANYHTPWRYVMVAKSAGELLENNYFILNLNAPCEIANTLWIKPGKVLREVTLTTEGGIACVDLAARNNIQYVEFDAGWYGPEYSKESDASAVNVDPKRSKGPLNLHHIIEYARQKDVGIIVYVNKNALEQQLDQILPLYQKWGVKGIKFGFVDVGDQYSTSWLHHAIRKAAKYELMVDVHDEYRPTGYSRTYPNLITQEGIRGDEESPSTEQALITIFTRGIAGAGDFTNCYNAMRVSEKMGGKSAQMAKSIMLYSPWQFIYWYDRPQKSPRKAGGAGGEWESLIDEKENATDFYKDLPTVWDETRVLTSDIGSHAAIARRKGTKWYVGILNAGTKRSLELNLDFITPNIDYTVEQYSQNEQELKQDKVNRQNINLKTPNYTVVVEKNAGAVLVIKPK